MLLRPCRRLWCLHRHLGNCAKSADAKIYVAGQFRGTAYGLYNMLIGFSFLAANLVFGFLFDSSGIAAAAIYGIATTVIAIASLAGFQALGRKMWAS